MLERGRMLPREPVDEIASIEPVPCGRSDSEAEIPSILGAPRNLYFESQQKPDSWFLEQGIIGTPCLSKAAQRALTRKLLQHYLRFDESRANPQPSPLGQPFDSGFDVLLAHECFWPEAHEAERWQWLSEDAGVVSLQLPEGGSIRFEYAYTALVQVEDRVLTERMLQQHGLPLAPDRAAVLLRPLDSLKSLRVGIMWYAETADYTEAFNRGCNEALQLVQCSWCPGHRCARVTMSANAHTALEGAVYS